MLGRRSHARISLEPSAEGLLSLAHDIWVRVNDGGLLVVISRDSAAVGERVRVLLAEDDVEVVAEIVESKSVVCDGAVRHRLVMRCSSRDLASLSHPTGQTP